MNDAAIKYITDAGALTAFLSLGAYALYQIGRLGHETLQVSTGTSDMLHHLAQSEPTPFMGRVNRFADVNRVIVTRRIVPVGRRQRCLRRFA